MRHNNGHSTKYSRLENKRTGYILENINESHLCSFLPNKQENPNYNSSNISIYGMVLISVYKLPLWREKNLD